MKKTRKKTSTEKAPKGEAIPTKGNRRHAANVVTKRSPVLISEEAAALREPKDFRPTLRPIRVPLQELLLDPNNPRILTDSDVPESEFPDTGIQVDAHERMIQGDFKLAELKQSILKNGWQPVDQIFVKQLPSGQFVVLEGNRRLTALRMVIKEDGVPKELLNAIDPLPVLEVVGTKDLEESRAQVTYLLGVRHHGSLKMWAPFARAHNMYERYLQYGRMTDDSFTWDDAVAERVADTLSVGLDAVRDALRVYRVMKQLEAHPAIKSVGIQGRYYSLVREVLSRPKNSPLRKYVAQDPATFRIDDASLSRIDGVCHFSQVGRQGAPISSPAEWRPLEKILLDPDGAKSAELLHQVEVEKKKPSDVYAMRAAELRQPRWDRWLKEVAELLKRLSVGELESTEEATDVSRRLATILDTLAEATAKKEDSR